MIRLSLFVAAVSLVVAVSVLILLMRQPLPPSNASPIWQAHHLIQSGIASWYGPRFHGRKTASGERFNQNAMTAAHRTLRFGTIAVVTRTNGRSVEVRINDRGPFIHGRIIDLSKAAAAELGMQKAGLASVQVQPVHMKRTQP